MPISKHCEQYGRRRSHFVFLFRQAKQSSAAPVAGARLRRLREVTTVEVDDVVEATGGGAAAAMAGEPDVESDGDDIAIMVNM